MTHNYFHIGILVADIEAAIAKFSRVFGVAFNPASVLPASMIWHGRRLGSNVRMTSSNQPPYIELIGGSGQRLFFPRTR
ncbi:MAG: hypothetical protein ABW110_01745 [Steroidobacteraceae bacterium]